jgi:hypothetical protein
MSWRTASGSSYACPQGYQREKMFQNRDAVSEHRGGRETLALSRGKPPIMVIGKYALLYIRITGALESYNHG